MGVISGIISPAKGFLEDPFNRYLSLGLLLLGILVLLFQQVPTVEHVEDEFIIKFFYLPTCPHCHEQMKFNERMMEKYDITVLSYDIAGDYGRRLYLDVTEKYGLPPVVPITVVDNRTFVGFDSSIASMLEQAIAACAAEKCAGAPTESEARSASYVMDLPILGTVDLRSYSLPTLAVMLGLVDGFNPCAMWVLVYLIGIIMSLRDKWRMWFIAGTFVFASGVLYFLFMTAWLNTFLFLGYIRAITVLVGLVALGGGILSLKQYIETKGALVCKVGDVESKQKTMDKIKSVAYAPLTLATILGIILLAFAINSIEFACSAAIPAAFTQILALSSLSTLEYYFYILLYDIFFMLDDMLIFSLAVFAVTSSVGDRYAKYCKIIGGILMVGIGLVLLFAPHLLY